MRWTVRVIQKCAVADQLSVKPSVVGMVDLFGHQAVEPRAGLSRGTAGIDRERGIGSKACTRRCGTKEDGERVFHDMAKVTCPNIDWRRQSSAPFGSMKRRHISGKGLSLDTTRFRAQ